MPAPSPPPAPWSADGLIAALSTEAIADDTLAEHKAALRAHQAEITAARQRGASLVLSPDAPPSFRPDCAGVARDGWQIDTVRLFPSDTGEWLYQVPGTDPAARLDELNVPSLRALWTRLRAHRAGDRRMATARRKATKHLSEALDLKRPQVEAAADAPGGGELPAPQWDEWMPADPETTPDPRAADRAPSLLSDDRWPSPLLLHFHEGGRILLDRDADHPIVIAHGPVAARAMLGLCTWDFIRGRHPYRLAYWCMPGPGSTITAAP